jgi:hypothetical protein
VTAERDHTSHTHPQTNGTAIHQEHETARRAAGPLAKVLPAGRRAGLNPAAVAWLRRLLRRGERAAGQAQEKDEKGGG